MVRGSVINLAGSLLEFDALKMIIESYDDVSAVVHFTLPLPTQFVEVTLC
jgi:hypothetical protein